MSVARVKILQIKNVIYFLIKYPIPKLRCKKLIIFPVARGNKILHHQESNLAVCRNHTLPVKNGSSTTPTFCLRSTTTSCALELTTRNSVNCSTTYNDLAPINTIGDGLVVINNQMVIVEEKGEAAVAVNGTYLVLYEDRVKINGSIFYNEKTTVAMKPEIPWASAVNLTEHTEILSVPYLHHVNQRNLQRIKHLQMSVERSHVAGISIIGILLIVVLIGCVLRRMVLARRQIAITESVNIAIKTAADRTVDVPHLEGEELS